MRIEVRRRHTQQVAMRIAAVQSLADAFVWAALVMRSRAEIEPVLRRLTEVLCEVSRASSTGDSGGVLSAERIAEQLRPALP